jgi:pimeloyl-ACP methyl ester carboxylesterase
MRDCLRSLPVTFLILVSGILILAPGSAAIAQTSGTGTPAWRRNPNAAGPDAQTNGPRGAQPWRRGPQAGQNPNAGAPSGGAPKEAARPLQWWTSNASAPSHVFTRGDLEIVTFETEQDYDRLQALYQQSQQAPPEPGTMVTRYYRSDIDGSVQPYTIWLPNGYSAEKRYPLVIQLHGTNFHEVLSGSRLMYHGMGGPQWIEPNLPVVYADCFGGPTTFYQGLGEVEVLKVIAEIKRLHPIDPDRVFIMGHSMGGAGSYTVGLHHPDQFGGIMAFDPAMGPHAAVIPDDVPKWMEPQIAIVTPAKLYPNARNVDVFFKNAGAGIQRNSTEYSDGIVAQGGFATVEVLPGMPHSFGEFYHNAAWVTELILHPVRRNPAEVKFYTNTLQWNQAYWVTIDRLTRHNSDASVTASYNEGSLRVTTSNIDALTLRLGDVPAPKGASAKLLVDGREVHAGPLSGVVELSKQSGQWNVGPWKSEGLAKRHGLQGPIGDAFNARFLAVYGEGDRDLAIAELDGIRNPIGPFDIHGDFPMKAAAKVTGEDVAHANLILFGTPESNVVLKRIAPELPAALLHAGSIFIYPNPESPSHYVVVWSTKLLGAADPDLRAGWTMPLNLLPDYVQVKGAKIVSGGHFDNEWKAPSAQ